MATRPSLDLAVLGTLAEQPLHGYELKKRLADLLGPWSSVSFGSLYPALNRLERGHLISAINSARPAPGSGSLNAELAAFRHAAGADPVSRRGKKAYELTPRGRDHLVELIDDPTGDDRAFAVRVAFCGVLPPPRRLALFTARRAALSTPSRARVDGPGDAYRGFLRDFQYDRVERELAWLDRLIAAETVSADGDEPNPTNPTTSLSQEGTYS